MTDTFEVRDHRNKSMFRIDDEYLNGYSKICGVNATLVYLCLCRHSDRHQESFPSIKLMAEKTGISDRSVMRGIQSLIDWNIISKERERKDDAKWLNNRYVLLDKSVWKSKPSDTQSCGSQLTENDEPSDSTGKSHMPHVHTKDTHIKVAHIEGGNPVGLRADQFQELINAFKEVNPFYAEFFKNLTERRALQETVNKIGYEKSLGLIRNLAEVNSREFYPKSTKPSELRRNLPKIVARMSEDKMKGMRREAPAQFINYNKSK